MAVKFQYNKVAMQQLDKQLKIRQKSLPTLQSKEAALRVEVKKAKDQAKEIEAKLQQLILEQETSFALWNEYMNGILTVKDVRFETQKIAGTETPVLGSVEYEVQPFSLFDAPVWLPDGIELLKQLVDIAIEKIFYEKKMELLGHARKKTTQKVNLYEKVQIPGFSEAIRKIKRFLEDEENLSKSAQKIVKTKQTAEA